jgi:hypothetical protein
VYVHESHLYVGKMNYYFSLFFIDLKMNKIDKLKRFYAKIT